MSVMVRRLSIATVILLVGGSASVFWFGHLDRQASVKLVCDASGLLKKPLETVKWLEKYEHVSFEGLSDAIDNGKMECGATYKWVADEEGNTFLNQISPWMKMADGTAIPSKELIEKIKANRADYPDAISDLSVVTGWSENRVRCILDGGLFCSRK